MKKKSKKSENSERWLLTYSDLITLLMILFIVLYSISNVNSAKYDKLSQSLNSALNTGILPGEDSVLENGSGIIDDGTNNSSSTDNSANTDNNSLNTTQNGDSVSEYKAEKKEFSKLREDISEIVNDSNLKGNVSITMESRGLIISFSDQLFFDSGKSEIKDNMEDTFDDIAKLLNRTDNLISVEGHTDNVPIHNSEYSSNWQLSSMRAVNVVEYLINNYNINPSRLSAIGYGEYRPVADNKTKDGRIKNRRVDIVLLYKNTNPDTQNNSNDK